MIVETQPLDLVSDYARLMLKLLRRAGISDGDILRGYTPLNTDADSRGDEEQRRLTGATYAPTAEVKTEMRRLLLAAAA